MIEKYQNVPRELRDLDQWCNHRRKFPINSWDGKAGSCTDPGTWAPFNVALKALEQRNCDGLSFAFNDCGIVGIDLDHCRDPESGELHPEAIKIVEEINSYTEISPSGTGLHIFAYGNMPEAGRKDSKKQKGFEIEMYKSARFFTVTGNQYADFGRLNDGAEAIDKLYNDLFKREPAPVVRKPIARPDKDFLSVGLQKDSVFQALWNGDRPSSDESSNDLALMNKLAYWLNCDKDQMITTFRDSPYAAGKGTKHVNKINRRDYLDRTANTAIRNCKSTAAEDNQNYEEKRASLKVDNKSDKAVGQKYIDPFTDKKRYSYSDMGNGYYFADNYKDVCRYSPESKGWFVFNGRFWELDKGDLMAKGKAKEISRFLLSRVWDIEDENIRKPFEAHAKKLFSASCRDIMLREAQTEYPIYLSCLDQNVELFNCQNGTLNLKTFEFRDHRAADLLGRISNVEYNPQAKCPRWIEFIDEIMHGDQEKSLFLQKALGYSLLGLANEECFFILYGETTRNGKGTCMETMLKLFGDYGKNAQPETLAAKKNSNSQNASEDLARLRGARFLNVSEPPKNMKLNEALAKTLTGSDTITARFLHQNSFEYKPQFVIFMNTNHKPNISDDSIFSSGRIKLIPFNRHFEENEQDRGLKAALSAPESLSGIFNWLLEGLQKYRKEGLKQPQVIIDAVAAYRKESDKIALFMEENVNKFPGFAETTVAVYARYSAWCKENGYHPESNKNFIQGLKAKGYEIVRNGHVGNRLKDCMLIQIEDME